MHSVIFVTDRYRFRMSVKRSLGEQIERAMRRRGWRLTGAELARQYNNGHPDAPITEQSANAWLRGRRLPDADNLQGLEKVLGIALDVSRQPAGSVRRTVQEAPTVYPAGTSDQLAWQAFLTLGKQRRKLVREVIHALAGSAPDEIPGG